MAKTELPVIAFATPAAWRTWLHKNHQDSAGIWIRFYKKASGQPSITYLQAVEEVLCYGWIDGLLQPLDEKSWKQRYTPRKRGSTWSKRNTQFAERLIRNGRMHAAGQKEVDAAKKDGRWKDAYDSPSSSAVPEDFLKELRKNKKALAFFESLNKANIYAITYRLQTAKKPQTREKRMKLILQMMKEEKKFH